MCRCRSLQLFEISSLTRYQIMNGEVFDRMVGKDLMYHPVHDFYTCHVLNPLFSLFRLSFLVSPSHLVDPPRVKGDTVRINGSLIDPDFTEFRGRPVILRIRYPCSSPFRCQFSGLFSVFIVEWSLSPSYSNLR